MFKKIGVKKRKLYEGPVIVIYREGSARFHGEAKDYIKDKKNLFIFFDEENKVLALQPTDEVFNSIKLSMPYFHFSLRHFCHVFNINLKESMPLICVWNNKKEWIEVDVSSLFNKEME